MAGSNATPRGVPRQILQGQGPRVQSSGAAQIPTIQYSSGSARALAEFSRNLFSLSNQYEDQLDEQAAAEASTAGAIDGATGDFELQNYGTIRGRAYNKAAIETFGATLDTQSMMRLAEIQQQYWNDPAGLQRAWGDYTKGVAEQLAKHSPEQAAAYLNRQTVRGIPAVEAAKDTNYKLTRSQADAALIENERAIRHTIKQNAADLFSENPERSRAAANAIQMHQRDFMQIYSAVDPTTGRPLYSPEEIAKAKAAFTDLTMSEAALSWFDEQPNKAEAYMRMTDGEFKIKLNATNDHVRIHMANQGRTRNDPIQPGLQAQLRAAAAATGEGLEIVVHSGGQETAEEVKAGKGSRTGSVRHDHGGAADHRLARGGKVLPFEENRELYLKYAENLAAAGVTGIGVDEAAGYIHAGGGSQASWGYRGKSASSAFLPGDFGQAIERGRAGERLETEPRSEEVPLSSTLSPEAFNHLDAEMRARISFSNSMADRQRAAEKAELEARQDLLEFEYMNRILSVGTIDPNTGKPITAPTLGDIRVATERGWLKPGGGTTIQKALTTERPQVSVESVVRDLTNRLYAGEDIYLSVIDAGSKLSAKDAAELLGKNQSVVRNQLGEFDADQKYSFDTLSDRLGSTGMFDKFDQGKENRKAQALDEYRRRVLDPNRTEPAHVIADDIAARATREEASMAQGALSSLVMPRFAVQVPGEYRVDFQQSGKALNAALASKAISKGEWQAQMLLLQKWGNLQTQADALNSKQKAK